MIAGISSINAAAASALSMLLRSDSSSLRQVRPMLLGFSEASYQQFNEV
jgi:hypothetical protein